MTIIAKAPVPSHLNLREADTGVIRTLFATSGATITPCPAWCELQGQHLVDEHEHPDDRAHFSVAGEVFCTLEQLAGEQPPRAWAALVQHDFDQQPRINAFLGVDRPIDMTPTEARQYAALLVELADRAGQTGTDR